MIRKPAPRQIRAYHDKHGCSLQEAKAALMKQWRLETLAVLNIQATTLNRPDVAVVGLIEYLTELEREANAP